MYVNRSTFQPLDLPAADAAQTMSSRMPHKATSTVLMSQADPSTFNRSLDRAAVAAAASAPNVRSAARRAVNVVDKCAKDSKGAAAIMEAQAAAAHQAGYKKVASQLEAVAEQLSVACSDHEQQAAHLRKLASYVEAGKPELAGVLGPVPAQSVVAGINPMLLRIMGAAYAYFLADRFLVSRGDPQRTMKVAAYALLGAFSPVFGSMGLLLYSNMRSEGAA